MHKELVKFSDNNVIVRAHLALVLCFCSLREVLNSLTESQVSSIVQCSHARTISYTLFENLTANVPTFHLPNGLQNEWIFCHYM